MAQSRSTTTIVVLLTALAAIGPVSTDLYLPSLPTIGEAFGSTVSQAQLTLSFFIAGFAVGTLFYGPLSDRVGRRPARPAVRRRRAASGDHASNGLQRQPGVGAGDEPGRRGRSGTDPAQLDGFRP